MPNRPVLVALLLLAVLWPTLPAAAAETLAGAHSVRDLADAARGVAPGGALFVSGVELEPDGPAEALELVRFEVLTPDARLVVHGADGAEERPLPERRFFRGRVAGAPGSLAVLAVGADGDVRGIVQRDGRSWVLGQRAGPESAGPRRLEAAKATARPAADDEPFTCGQEDLPQAPPSTQPTSLLGSLGTEFTSTPHTARVAIETDYEFYEIFNDSDAATAYIMDVMAYASTIYDDEIDTDLQVSHVSLHDEGANADPWDQSNPLCALYQMGRYWNDNNTSISRSIAHFFSGRGSDVGVAWLGVLCDGQFFVDHEGDCLELSPQIDNYGGGYGYSGGLDGNFDIDNPSIVWDIMVVSHEIGHNFNSPHTHCYMGLGGSSEPIDKCVVQLGATCWQGATSLPCGTPGAGCGTLMSYCHFQPGNLSNIALTFGAGHPHGVLPQRVPDRMRAHVESEAAGSSCLDRIQPPDCHQLTRGHTGSGADPVASPGSSDVCDAGSYLEGEAITLTADPADGWSVASWSGTDDDGSLSKFNSVTMPAADRVVSVTYQSGCTDLALTSGSDGGVQTYDVCGTITAGGTYHVTGSGDVTMISRERVVFQDGFRVESGGALAVEVNP